MHNFLKQYTEMTGSMNCRSAICYPQFQNLKNLCKLKILLINHLVANPDIT